MSRIWTDHVILAVDDLDAAAGALEEREGLASVAGGRHPGWGTSNRIVPLGESYLELVTVVDAEEANGSGFGRAVLRALDDGRPLVGTPAEDRPICEPSRAPAGSRAARPARA